MCFFEGFLVVCDFPIAFLLQKRTTFFPVKGKKQCSGRTARKRASEERVSTLKQEEGPSVVFSKQSQNPVEKR